MEKDTAPGTPLGTEEEYMAGSGTYSEGGVIYSSTAGAVRESDKKLAVSQRAELRQAGRGAIVYGRIENIIEPIALISVVPISPEGVRFACVPNYCVLKAANVKVGYVRQIHDEFKIGDIIKAKVIEVKKDELVLGTEEDEFGVVKAFCTVCRNPLALVGSSLVCEECGSKERRKLSKEYWCVK
jgi:exosome complex component CSL4